MTRTLLPVLLTFFLGAAVALAALATASRVAHATPAFAGAWSPVPPPDGRTGASALPDARTSASALPAPAAEPQRDPWRTGIPLGLLMLGVAAFGLGARQHDPKRYWLWSALAGAALLVVDALRTGQPPSVEMVGIPALVLGAGVMPGTMRQRPRTVVDPLAVPEHIPEGDTDRDPERGSARASLLITMMTIPALVLGAGMAWSCAGVRAAGGIVTDCAVAVAPAELEKARPVVEAAIANATRPDGSIDVAPLLDVARTMSLAVGGCAIAEGLTQALAAKPPTFAPRTGPAPEDRTWAQVKAAQYPGRGFRLASGAVL